MSCLPRLLISAVGLALAQGSAQAVEGKIGEYSDAVVQAHILEPRKLKPTDANIGRIKAPDGFRVSVFARDLVNPRMLAAGEDGTVYATRRSVGDVIMLKDTDGDGKAHKVATVAGRANMHGIAIDGRKA